MVALLKRLTNLSIVANVLQSPTQYPTSRQGFTKDRQNLQSDAKKVSSSLNRNIEKYGNKKYTG
ncbi:hypothetical protein A6A19_01575 [Actinobacillus delphinicola]|uniref:Uncharacterized protein n=1 Tax=Actinobacillus delphinicola TaxID=51161 RepID=A0A448TW28_9PAST|nr:hypothetical protein [Actinobacillus delphinicola]MDG6896716.1 hypothetical protein [Actinobacillus delphinicola]VEJ10148.1 Uncharacterised protein [Actinobacillus delphinicola]